jgi:hypothetical protein
MAMSELKQRLLKIGLARLGFRDAAYNAEQDIFYVNPSDERMPRIYDNGDIHFGCEHNRLVKHEIQPAVSIAAEQATAWEKAPAVPFEDLSEYRILSEYNNIVLAARDDSELGYGHGLYFVTWEYSYERTGFTQGNYAMDYEAAKEDFALRCGLIDRNKLFSETEMKLIRQGLVHLGVSYPDLTFEQNTLLGKVVEKIEMIVPEIQERDHYEAHDLIAEDGLEM